GRLTIKNDYRPTLLIDDNFMPSAVAAGFENGCDIVIKRTSSPGISYGRTTRQSLSGVRVGYESNYVLDLSFGLNCEYGHWSSITRAISYARGGPILPLIDQCF